MRNFNKYLIKTNRKMKNGVIRVVLFCQAIVMLLAGIVWSIKDDYQKWFEYWALGLILLGLYGVMNQIDDLTNKDK